MKQIAQYSLVMLSLLTGCTAHGQRTAAEIGGMPYGKWDFVFFTPHALPASVTRAMIIDKDGMVSVFRTLDNTPDDAGTVSTWNNQVYIQVLFNKATYPPAAMLFCWDSIIDKRTYETRIIFEPSLRETMLTPTGKDSYGDTAWYDTLLFGLAPEGKVRIWLQNSAPVENIPLTPKKITTLSGDKLDVCKGITTHTQGYGYTKTTQEFIRDKTYPYGSW
ncbi:DUF2931 family protein [Phytobacter sp. AG2a]